MTVSRFRRRTTQGEQVSFLLDGAPATARAGDTIAAALLAWDGKPTRQTGVSQSPRTPYCMMGVCHECLVTLDGQPNRQGCLIEITEGMDIRRQSCFRKLGVADD